MGNSPQKPYNPKMRYTFKTHDTPRKKNILSGNGYHPQKRFHPGTYLELKNFPTLKPWVRAYRACRLLARITRVLSCFRRESHASRLTHALPAVIHRYRSTIYGCSRHAYASRVGTGGRYR